MKVSIITVTYNCKSVLNHCLDSVFSQSFDNIEHIVVDGGSTDGTLSLLNSRRSSLSAIISEPDNGIYDAMNKGIELANGDIIGFLNSDDFYADKDVISKVEKIFKKDLSLDGCYADLIYVDKRNINKTVRYFKSSKFQKGFFAKGWCPPHPTFFLRRSVYERFGKFNLKYRIASDIDLMMRFLEVYKIKTLYVPQTWVKMRMGGTTNKNFKNIWIQNQEILSSFSKEGIKFNIFSFFIHKIISRLKQFLKH